MARIGIDDPHDAPGDVCTRVWMDAMFMTATPHEARLEVETRSRVGEIKIDGKLVATYHNERQSLAEGRRHHRDQVWDTDHGLVRLEDIHQRLRIRVLTDNDPEAASSILQEIRRQIVPPPRQKTNEVKVKFWRMTPQGGSAFTRSIAAPTWRSIERNYAPTTRGQLHQLMRLKPRQLGTGKIILLHGCAGTGKTTAIRGMAREWQKWCNFAYAVDPEQVFGNGEYLTSLIADEENHDRAWMDDDDDNVTATKWRVLVIEDAEEFLIPDAKHEVGQAVSRLLNVGDGILGQGLKLLVMLTTNVPVGKLSPAITRPGRCLANIEVPAMTKSEATEWLGRDAPGSLTLAELWETTHQSQIGTGVATGTTPGQYL
jgi:hypothetical protein